MGCYFNVCKFVSYLQAPEEKEGEKEENEVGIKNTSVLFTEEKKER